MIDFRDSDRQIWEEELESFVPAQIFDAHAHLFDRAHIADEKVRTDCMWETTDLPTLRDWASRLFPGREVHWLLLGTPVVGIDVAAHAAWMVDQVSADLRSRMNRLVTPSCRVDQIKRDIESAGGAIVGLKPYRLFSVTGDAAQCRIHEFLPHEQLELANELHLWVTMHLSRFDGCADEANLDDLEEFTTRRYPKIRWILAHCARSFTYWPIQQAVARLSELPNIWYDVSAVTDVRPLATLFREEQIERIFFGSDGVDATYFHGQYVALGRSWQALDADRTNLRFPHCDGRPILAIYEQLLAMKHAAEFAELSPADVEAIFWRNAANLFSVEFATA